MQTCYINTHGLKYVVYFPYIFRSNDNIIYVYFFRFVLSIFYKFVQTFSRFKQFPSSIKFLKFRLNRNIYFLFLSCNGHCMYTVICYSLVLFLKITKIIDDRYKEDQIIVHRIHSIPVNEYFTKYSVTSKYKSLEHSSLVVSTVTKHFLPKIIVPVSMSPIRRTL